MIFSWLAIFGAGLFLGLFGGGGGLLLIPALTLGFGLTPSEASLQSIVMVGASCMVGVGLHARLGNVEFKKGILFSIPAVISIFISRALLPIAIPELAARDRFLLYFFAGVVLTASFFMIRPQKPKPETENSRSLVRTAGGGVLSGFIMGLAGAGGGFVIVPSLNIGLGIPIRKAIGTSLWVIAFSSTVFFISQAWMRGSLDGLWDYSRGGVSLLGVPFGIWLSQKVPAARLRPAFGVFALAIAVLTLVLRS